MILLKTYQSTASTLNTINIPLQIWMSSTKRIRFRESHLDGKTVVEKLSCFHVQDLKVQGGKMNVITKGQ